MKPVVEMYCRLITVRIHELLLKLKNVSMYLLEDIKCNYNELRMPLIYKYLNSFYSTAKVLCL